MRNCIFTANCLEGACDTSCPKYVETSYLLERNDIKFNSSVFKASLSDIQRCNNILSRSNGNTGVVTSKNTVELAELLTYCAICNNWEGSQLHCTVYNLKYSLYLDLLKQSWSQKQDSDELTYMKIWQKSAKVLIISNLDYVNFGDFESQTLLNLIQTRTITHGTTLFVTPKIADLVGHGIFFSKLQNMFMEVSL